MNHRLNNKQSSLCDYCKAEFSQRNSMARFCSYLCFKHWRKEGDWSVYVKAGRFHFIVDNRGIREVV